MLYNMSLDNTYSPISINYKTVIGEVQCIWFIWYLLHLVVIYYLKVQRNTNSMKVKHH